MGYTDDADASPSASTNPLGFDRDDAVKIEEVLLTQQEKWSRPTTTIQVGTKQWLPNLIGKDDSLCHVHLTEELSAPWLSRIRSARQDGRTVVVAAPLPALYSSGTLEALASTGCEICLLQSTRNGAWKPRMYRSVLEFIAMEGILLDGDLFTKLGRDAFDSALAARTNHLRGRLFEDLLCLVFSQVPYFKVFAHNYKNRTQEIDVVLRNRSTAGGDIPVCPLVLVSGKNTTDPADVRAFGSLETKMRDRRGQCKVGFLCSARSIASTVGIQELRGSREERVIVLIDGPRLRSLIDAGSGIDEAINRLTVEAMLS